jgi:hypothetical protein
MRLRSEVDVETVEGMQALSRWLPAGWRDKCRELGAFSRARAIKSELDLLRLLFAYVILRKSFPELALWARDRGIAELAYPSLWERFVHSVKFLTWLLESLLASVALPPGEAGLFVPLDATTFSLPGSTKRDWLVHAAWADGGFRVLKLSKAKGKGNGESLRRFEEMPAPAVALTDRAYGTPPQLARWQELGKRYISRFTWNNLPIYEVREGGEPVDPEQWLKDLSPGEYRERWAWVRPQGKGAFAVRIVVVRLDPGRAAHNRRKAYQLSTRKGHTPRRVTLFLAEFLTLVTNLKEEELATRAVCEAYRWRWQIELAFKRFKSSTLIRRLVNQKADMVRVYLCAALCLWLLTERMAQHSAFFPWGCPLGDGDTSGNRRPSPPAEVYLGTLA